MPLVCQVNQVLKRGKVYIYITMYKCGTLSHGQIQSSDGSCDR